MMILRVAEQALICWLKHASWGSRADWLRLKGRLSGNITIAVDLTLEDTQ
jgi:hypothetical protein